LHQPFTFVNVRGDRATLSGHPKVSDDGAIEGPYGQLGSDLRTDQGYEVAEGIGLTILANLQVELGDLSRITGRTRAFGMVNSAPGYADHHLVLNGLSDLILETFGPEIGRRSRSATGVSGLPLNFALEIEGGGPSTP
jgi:hypothetical protein